MTRRIRTECAARSAPDRTAVRRTIVTRRTAARRTDRSPVGGRQRTRPAAAWPAADGEHGCVRRRARARGPGRTPHAVVCRCLEDREGRCTTALQPGYAALARRCARTRCAPGCARSSRKTVTTLGAAGLQHCPAGSGAHTVPKAVLLGTTTVVGLECALHAALLEPPCGGGSASRKLPWRAELLLPRLWPDDKTRGARGATATVRPPNARAGATNNPSDLRRVKGGFRAC